MKLKKVILEFGVLATVIGLAGCGGGSSNNNPGSGGGGGSTVNNTVAVQVNSGPAHNFINGLFVSVTVCVPGTTNCQTIPDVSIDTGSEGLRLLSSAVGSLPLPAVNDNTSNQLQECVQFADMSYIWGPIVTADIEMAGEKGSSVPIQLIPNPASFAVPSNCASGGGPDLNTLSALGANGIIGLGVFQQDCGGACTPTSSQVPAVYYLCPNSVCQVATVPLLTQIQQPVWTFSQPDNNGFLISMPAITSVPDTGAVSVSGTMSFGIGTQTDNALGTAKIYTTDANGNFQATYNGVSYSNSFIDSGSNGLYVLDAATLGNGMADCTQSNLSGFYCPAATTSFTATNTGLNGVSAPVTFNIADANTLFTANGANNWAFDNLGGPSSTPIGFDYGMPFFYNRTVFIGIENQTSPTGVVGPYWAY